jgi:hypothetical protein
MAIFVAATLACPEGTLKNCRRSAENTDFAALAAEIGPERQDLDVGGSVSDR